MLRTCCGGDAHYQQTSLESQGELQRRAERGNFEGNLMTAFHYSRELVKNHTACTYTPIVSLSNYPIVGNLSNLFGLVSLI